MLIRWTDPAIQDLIHFCDESEAKFDESRGRRTALQIHEAVNSLATFPHIGRFGRKPDTFELVISGLPFILIYKA